MTKRSVLSALLGLALLAPEVLPLRPLPEAAAAELVRDAVLGARIEDEIAMGDVDAFRVPLLAGTELRARLSAEEDDDVPGKDEDPVRPELVALDLSGAEVARVAADSGEIRRSIGAAGTYRFEVRAGTYSGGYELRIEGEGPRPSTEDSRTPVVVLGAPVVVHVDAPALASVEIELRRRSGAAPRIDAVADSLGRALTVFVRSSRPNRVRLEDVPVAVAGGLDVTVSAAGGGPGTYELRTKVRLDPGRPPGGDEHESRRIVVRLAAGADAAAFAASRGWTLVSVEGDLAVFETPEDRDGHEDEDADDADDSPEVLAAAPDVIAQSPEGSQSNAPVIGSVLGRGEVEGQAALAAIHAAQAHARATGRGVVVAVLDGGVESAHEFLAGRVMPGRDFVDGDADPSEAANGLDDDGDGLVDEGFGHGTFVASLVLAAAPDASILPVRVLDTDGRGRSSAIAAGIEWAADHGAHVMNVSFGTLGGNATIGAAVSYAQARGVTVVASTGNAGRATVVDFPAALPGVVAVTALDATGARAPFANAGASTTLAAPGTDLAGAYPGGLYARWSGTSFAAAFVSGGAALALERTPDAAPARVAALLARRAHAFRGALPRAERRLLGGGVLDLARLVR